MDSFSLILLNIITVVFLGFVIIFSVRRSLRGVKTERERKANEMTRKLLETSPLYIEIWDDKSNILDCNKQMLEILGLSSVEEYRSRYSEFVPEFQPCGESSHTKGTELISKALREGSSRMEWTRHKPDGELLPMEVTLVRMELDGKTIIVGYNHDLRPVKAAQQKEREAKELTQTLLDSAPFVVGIWDDDCRLTSTNMQAKEMFGIPDSRELGGDWVYDFSPELQPCGTPSREKVFQCINEAHLNGTARFEWMHTTAAGEPLPAEVVAKRFKRKGKDMIVSYTMDMRPVKAAMENERAAMEREREASEINEVFNISPFVVNIWDDGLNLVATSRQSVKMFGLSGQKQYLERFSELSPELQPCGTPSMEKAVNYVRQAFSEGGVTFEWMHQTLSGEPVPSEVTLTRFSRHGKYMVAAYTVDLRQIKAAMEKEREANERAQMLLETSPLLIEIWDDEMRVIDCNQRMMEAFGLSSKEEYIRRHFEFNPELQPSGRPSYKNAVDCAGAALRNGSAQFEWMHKKPDGELLPVDVTCVRIERDGKPIIVGYNHDLRPIKALMEREFDAKERARVLIDVAPMPCYLLDANLQAVGCNESAIELFVKEPGKTLSETYPGEKFLDSCNSLDCTNCSHHRHHTCMVRKFLVDNYRYTFVNYAREKEQVDRSIAERCQIALEAGIYRCELTTVTLYGAEIPCEVTIVPVKLLEGHGFASYRRDLREERRREIAERESMAKTQFLAHTSHEIRTPMNAILGMAELALRSGKLDVIREHILTVKQAGTNLLSIINDILDISKIEKGKLEIVPMDYQFSSLMNDVIGIIKMRIMDSRIRFAVSVDSSIPNSLRGDEVRIRQVMLNLLNNAVKYNDNNGFIHLRIAGEVDGDTVKMVIDVEDSGQGIKKENIGTLFDEYSRFDMEKNKGTEGTGLGLAIVWHLVQAMNGEINVRSEYGRGSMFTVTLSQEVRSHEPLCRVENPAEKSSIVYERRDVYTRSLMFTMGSLGVDSAFVSNDFELLEKLDSGKYAFAFIPFELYVKNSKAIAELGVETKIVILTKFGEAVSEKNLTSIALPVHSLSVATVLNGGRGDLSHHESVGFAVSFAAPDAHVLVVDDVLTNLKVAKGLLAPYGMQVSLCTSGEMALDAISINRYDIIFTDYLMPGMDGVEVMGRIRKLGEQDRHFAEVPIIMLTANVVSGMQDFFMDNGFNDFLSKPMDVSKLDAILEKWVPKEKQLRLTTGERKDNGAA